jgi:hypothetical protein
VHAHYGLPGRLLLHRQWSLTGPAHYLLRGARCSTDEDHAVLTSSVAPVVPTCSYRNGPYSRVYDRDIQLRHARAESRVRTILELYPREALMHPMGGASNRLRVSALHIQEASQAGRICK